MAWLNYYDFSENAKKGVDFIIKKSKNGVFGSSQSTILALKAIVKYQE